MMNWRKFLLAFWVILLVCLSAPVVQTKAVTTTCDSYDGTNIESQNYDRWSSVVNSYLTVTNDGKIMKVQNTKNDGVIVEYYDKNYNFVSNKKIAAELPIFGGFYASDSNYYLITGQSNPSQLSTLEVVRITKYDKSWKRIKSTGLYDCNTTVPFDAGSCRMTMLGKYLLIRTAHEMYKSDDGYNHQSNMTIQVDTNTMTITDSYSGVKNTGWGYASHSFNQFIKMDGNQIVAVDHGDAYPRSIALFKYKTDASTGSFVPTYYKQCDVVDVLAIPGTIGDNATNATVGGFELSDTSYLIAGNSVIQDSNNLKRTTRNVYVAAINKSTNAVTMNWLTSFAEGETTTRTPHMVEVYGGNYMVLWSRDDKVYYALVDKNGNKTGNTYNIDGHLSDCVPIVVDKKIVWYTWNDGQILFYEISLDNYVNANVVELNNGHTYIHNKVENGVSTLTCTTCGMITQVNVPTSMNVWWREEEGAYGGYSSGVTTGKNAGDVLHCWITYEGNNVNTNFQLISSNPDVISAERTSDSNNIMYKLKVKNAGTTTITVTHKYNPNLKKSVTFNVSSKVSAEINGFQISATNKGFRTVYSVSNPANEIVSAGLVYGLSDYVKTSQMVVGSSNKYVYNFEATESGKIDSTFSKLEAATSYAMTMQFGECIPVFFNASTMVRAYVKLNNGTYIYSDIKSYTIYNVADKIYQNNWMKNITAHNYLYNDILSKVTANYKKVTFTAGNSLVTP